MFLNHPILSRRLRNREFREVPGMPMIVFNNVLCFVILPDLPSLSGDCASTNSAEFRMVPGRPMIVFNNVLCFVILPSLPETPQATANSAGFRAIPVISMIVFQNIICLVIIPSLPRDSATANSACFRECQ